MMKYIDLVNRFWRLHKTHRFTGNQTMLYFYLLSVFNEQGWPDSFDQSDTQTEGNSGISKNTMKGCRDRLIEVGLIGFSEGGHGKGNRGTYEIRYQKLTPTDKPVRCQDRYQKMTPKNGPKVSVKVSTKVSEIDTYTLLYRDKTLDILSLLKKGVSFSVGFSPKKQEPPEEVKAPPVAAAPPPIPEPAPRIDPYFDLKGRSENCNVPFSDWYSAYRYIGGESVCRRLWSLLTDEERTQAMQHTPSYVAANPDKRFRKYPINYLEDKIFNDEIIDRNVATDPKPKSGRNAPATGQREVIRTEYVQQKFPRSGGASAKSDESRKSDAA